MPDRFALPKAQTFDVKARKLSDSEEMHLKALRSAAEMMLGVCNSDTPDPDCRDKAIDKLKECFMWMELGIRIGVHL